VKVRSLSKFSANDEMYEDETGSKRENFRMEKLLRLINFPLMIYKIIV
jgi:hypothetical protein